MGLLIANGPLKICSKMVLINKLVVGIKINGSTMNKEIFGKFLINCRILVKVTAVDRFKMGIRKFCIVDTGSKMVWLRRNTSGISDLEFNSGITTFTIESSGFLEITFTKYNNSLIAPGFDWTRFNKYVTRSTFESSAAVELDSSAIPAPSLPMLATGFPNKQMMPRKRTNFSILEFDVPR